MVEIQFAPLENVSAILTGVLVALENIMASELHFFLRQSIEQQKDNHSRDSDLPRDGGNHLVFRSQGGEIEPAVEIVGEEVILRIGGNDLCVALIDESKSATRRADVNRLPKAVQNQNLAIKDCVQISREGIPSGL